METKQYIKVFASLGIYFGLVPQSIIDVENLKGASSNDSSNRLYSKDLEGVDVSALYLMQHIDDGCTANCAFCIQAKESEHKRKKSYLVDKEMIRLPLETLTNYLANHPKAKDIKRVCIQTIFNSKTVENLMGIIKAIREASDVPITACCIPISKDAMMKLKDAGLDHMTINYETATPALFSKIRGEERNGPYRWDKVTQAIDNALEVFGDSKVGSHLQIGLGETQKEALEFVQDLHRKNVFVSLFAFTPVQNTAMADAKRISHGYFHQVQLGSYLIKNNKVDTSRMKFDSKGMITDYGVDEYELTGTIDSGIPFRNAGCPGCNRVYYETNPGERSFSYPRALSKAETELIKGEIMGERVC